MKNEYFKQTEFVFHLWHDPVSCQCFNGPFNKKVALLEKWIGEREREREREREKKKTLIQYIRVYFCQVSCVGFVICHSARFLQFTWCFFLLIYSAIKLYLFWWSLLIKKDEISIESVFCVSIYPLSLLFFHILSFCKYHSVGEIWNMLTTSPTLLQKRKTLP